MNLTPSRLEHLFKLGVRRPIQEVVRRRRLQEAAHLLVTTYKWVSTNREGSLGELVERLMPKATRTQRTAAEKELLAANPHLEELKQLPAGTPVVVPDEVQQADVRDVVQDRLHAALVTAFDAMRQTRAELAAEIRAEDEGAKRSQEWLKSDEVQGRDQRGGCAPVDRPGDRSCCGREGGMRIARSCWTPSTAR
ncbi:MAG: hypothetical protein ACXW5U_05135 [Thermoanaerobaculia bacterium]